MGQESSGNMIVKLIRPILVFLLEIHFIRFVLLLFMSLVYDTYTSGKKILNVIIIFIAFCLKSLNIQVRIEENQMLNYLSCGIYFSIVSFKQHKS